MLLAPGHVFAGRQVVGLIGSGSSGEVYRVVDLDGHPAALKVISPAVARTPAGEERFRRECEIAETLQHPHVVQVRAHGDTPVERGRPPLLWSVMELLEGGTAVQLVPRRHTRPDVAVVLDVLRQVALGLDHVHAQDVVHRDVKPANVLLSRARPLRAALTDFGIAQFLDDVRPVARNGRVQGSLPYASPEVLMAHRIGPAADLYSLTCTAVELLTGTPPFPLPTTFAIAHAHISTPPPLLTRRRRWLPAALDAVVARGLAKDPAARYRSCLGLVRAMEGTFGVRDGRASGQPAVPGSAGTALTPGDPGRSPRHPHVAEGRSRVV